MSEGVIIPLETDSAKEPELRCRVCGERLNPNGNCIGILLKIDFCLGAHGIEVPRRCQYCGLTLEGGGTCPNASPDAPRWQQRNHGTLFGGE